MWTAAARENVPHRSLLELVRAGATGDRLAERLDALDDAGRLREVLAVAGRNLRRLYEACAASPPASLHDLVPEGTPAGATVVHEGRNSLPLFSRFQKRFARLTDGTVVGHNHQPMRLFTGPGYFVAVATPEREDGAVLLDYTALPSAEPLGWPPYRSNARGLSRLVFQDLEDFMRRVARGVLVGKATKRGVDQDAYFSLTRVT